MGAHRPGKDQRTALGGVSSLLIPSGFQGSNSGPVVLVPSTFTCCTVMWTHCILCYQLSVPESKGYREGAPDLWARGSKERQLESDPTVNNTSVQGLGHALCTENLPTVHEALASVPAPQKRKSRMQTGPSPSTCLWSRPCSCTFVSLPVCRRL